MLTEIPLNQSNDFLKMLFTLMESKKSQGVLNVDFGFENLLDMISPKKVMDDIRQVRKEIRYNYAKYAELEDGDPAKLDVGDKLNEPLRKPPTITITSWQCCRWLLRTSRPVCFWAPAGSRAAETRLRWVC